MFLFQYIPTMSVEVQPWPDGRYNLGRGRRPGQTLSSHVTLSSHFKWGSPSSSTQLQHPSWHAICKMLYPDLATKNCPRNACKLQLFCHVYLSKLIDNSSYDQMDFLNLPQLYKDISAIFATLCTSVVNIPFSLLSSSSKEARRPSPVLARHIVFWNSHQKVRRSSHPLSSPVVPCYNMLMESFEDWKGFHYSPPQYAIKV